jgi:hypothetical protein
MANIINSLVASAPLLGWVINQFDTRILSWRFLGGLRLEKASHFLLFYL